MPNQNTYKDLIFTNHAYHRLKQRSLSEHGVWKTVHHPKRTTKKGENTKFIRAINDRTYHVVSAYLPKEQKHLIISVWVRGEDDQLPLMWQLLTLPFKLVWSLLRWLFKQLNK